MEDSKTGAGRGECFMCGRRNGGVDGCAVGRVCEVEMEEVREREGVRGRLRFGLPAYSGFFAS